MAIWSFMYLTTGWSINLAGTTILAPVVCWPSNRVNKSGNIWSFISLYLVVPSALYTSCLNKSGALLSKPNIAWLKLWSVNNILPYASFSLVKSFINFCTFCTSSGDLILSLRFSGVGNGSLPSSTLLEFCDSNLIAASESFSICLCWDITRSTSYIFSANTPLTGSSLNLASVFSKAINSDSSLFIACLCCIKPFSVGAGLSSKFFLASLISIIFSLILSLSNTGLSCIPNSCLVWVSKLVNSLLIGLPSANGPSIPSNPHTAADANLSSWLASQPALKYPVDPNTAILGTIFSLFAIFNILPVP